MKRELWKLPWSSPRTYLLARLIGTSLTEVIPFGGRRFRYEQSEGLEASAQAMESLRRRLPRLLALHIPIYQELVAKERPDVLRQYLLREPAVLSRIPFRQETEFKNLFNIPYDPHFSDAGAPVFARVASAAVHDFVESMRRTESQNQSHD